MLVIPPAAANRVATPNAVMTRLAAPSLGSTELSIWQVRMEPGAAGPAHTVDREQVWLVRAGTIEATVDGATGHVAREQTLVVPAGVERRFRTAGDEAAEAVVCMRAEGLVSVPGQAGERPLPWAE